MTTFRSPVKLGDKYKDERTGIEGHATVLCFNTHGCVEIILEFEKDGKIENAVVNELRLTSDDKDALGTVYEHESDLILDHKYEDIQTGIQGHTCVVEFHEFMATRGIIRTTTTNAKGSKDLKYYSIDDFLLKDLETKKVAKRKDDKPSPVSHEVKRR